ncbi:MAG: CARDB domain-containing protein, partial [Chloroflexota bacterium]
EIINFTLFVDTTQAIPLYLKADADDVLTESDEANNIYNTGIPLSPDLTVGAVNVSNLRVDPNSLATTGTISAVINSDVDIPLTFDVLFYEDIDVNDGGFNSAIDNILSTESVSSISGGIPYIVTTEPSDTLQFVNAPINVFVDSGEVIIESNENNNVASSTSSNLPDLTASHLTQVNNGTNATITVRVGNGGGAVAPAGISVAFFDQDPNSGATPLETTTVNMSIASGTYEEVTVVVPLPASPEVSRLWVWVDNTETIDETNELNNVYLSNQYLTQVTNAAPVVTVGTSVTVTEGSEVVDGVLSLEATVTDDNLPMGMLTTQWTVELGEPNAVIFDSIDEVDTTVTFTVAGTYTLRLTADDGALNDYAEIDVTYIVPPPPPLPSYYLDIDGCIASPLPLSGENLTPLMGVVDIELESTVNLIDAAVYYWPSYDPQQYMLLGSGLSVTGGGTIATFDTTALANGSYGLQVVGTDPSTDERVVCGVGVVVGGEYKPGRVVLSTTDFTVPLAGMPITVGRTYDSLERNIEGDFGYGWNLSIADPRLEVDDSNNVTLTLPSGERKTFFWTPMGNGFVQSLGTPHYTSE